MKTWVAGEQVDRLTGQPVYGGTEKSNDQNAKKLTFITMFLSSKNDHIIDHS